MKRVTFCLLGFLAGSILYAQEQNVWSNAFQIKIDPLPLAYDYSRMGIGLEKKLNRHSIWSTFYWGTNLDMSQLVDDPNGHYNFWGIQVGLKRILPTSAGEFYYGIKTGFDKSRKFYSGDVYYDLDGNFAVLYDAAYYYRTRLNLTVETGHEFYVGNRFSIEISSGAGIVSLQNGYKYVENPFHLEGVYPKEKRRKLQHKYVDDIWRLGFSAAVKFGWRL